MGGSVVPFVPETIRNAAVREGMIRTQIQLTDDLAAHIKELASREQVSRAEMIRRALTRFLETAPKAGRKRAILEC
jgi:metal-responsive CopG/Arc/MetJ family transcriptional regulator